LLCCNKIRRASRGGLFCGAPVRPNMLNMSKSAADHKSVCLLMPSVSFSLAALVMTSVVTQHCRGVDITELKRGKMLVIQTGLVMALLARYRVIMHVLCYC